MFPLKISLYIGLFLRPIEILAISYLLYKQLLELRIITPFQRIKWMLFSMFSVNILLYAFSWFIDIVGIFGLFQNQGVLLLALYLLINTVSGLATTVLLWFIYTTRVQR